MGIGESMPSSPVLSRSRCCRKFARALLKASRFDSLGYEAPAFSSIEVGNVVLEDLAFRLSSISLNFASHLAFLSASNRASSSSFCFMRSLAFRAIVSCMCVISSSSLGDTRVVGTTSCRTVALGDARCCPFPPLPLEKGRGATRR
jgi:hypothetical protein